MKSHSDQKSQQSRDDESIESGGWVDQTEAFVLADDGERQLMEHVNAKRILSHVASHEGVTQPPCEEIRCTHKHEKQTSTPVISKA